MKMIRIPRILLIAGVFAVFCFLAIPPLTAKDVKLGDLDSAVRSTIESHLDGGVIEEIELEKEDGQMVYEVEGRRNGKEFEFLVSTAGKFLGEEEDDDDDDDEEKIDFDDAPAAVRKTIKKIVDGGTIDEIEREKEHGAWVYEVEYEVDGEDREVEMDVTGRILKDDDDDDNDDSDGDSDGDDEEEEEDIAFSDAPSAVQDTINRIVGSRPLRSLEREKDHGVYVYEAEFSKGGDRWEFEMNENGQVLEFEIEDDDDDDDHDHDHGHDDDDDDDK